MSLEQKIEEDLRKSMKTQDSLTLATLRMVKAALTNLKIKNNTEILDDACVLDVLQQQVKQRHESVESFAKAARPELAKKEQAEINILSVYLPKQLTDDELVRLVRTAITETGAASKADAGKVMKWVMPRAKGVADGKRVNMLVLQHLK